MSQRKARAEAGQNKSLRKKLPQLSAASGRLCAHGSPADPLVLLLDLDLRAADGRIAVPIAVPLADAVAARVSPEAQAATGAELLALVARATGNNRSGECRALSDAFSTFTPGEHAGIVLRHRGRSMLLMPACGAFQPFTWGKEVSQ